MAPYAKGIKHEKKLNIYIYEDDPLVYNLT